MSALAPTANRGDQPDSNRLREGHGLSCCHYTMAANDPWAREDSNLHQLSNQESVFSGL